MSSAPVAIVSGGSRGIGFACTCALAEDGYAVTFTGRDREQLHLAEREVSSFAEHQPVGKIADAASAADADQLVAETVADRGRLDVVIANAGEYLGKSIEETTPEEWAGVVEANLNGSFFLLRAALSHLRGTAGHAIAIGSLSGTRGYGDEAAYGASKRALRILTESISQEAAVDGVRATLISPGVVRTRMAAAIFGADYEEAGDAPGTLVVGDVAATIRYLLALSPAAVVDEIVLRDTRWAYATRGG